MTSAAEILTNHINSKRIIVTPIELFEKYTDEFYLFTNRDEIDAEDTIIHYKTGINTNILPFYPGTSAMIFFHSSQLTMMHRLSGRFYRYIRKVNFTENSKIYIGRASFTADEILLGEREIFNTAKHVPNYLDSDEGFVMMNHGGYSYKLYCEQNQTPEICKSYLEIEGHLLKYVRNQTPELCRIAVQKDGFALKYVEKQTEELCIMAVKQNGNALEYVENQTEKICKLAVLNDGFALQFVKIQTDELCKLAIQQNSSSLKYVKNKTEEMCIMAVEQDNSALQHVENQTEEMCKMCLFCEPTDEVFRSIKNKTYEICELAVSLNGLLLAYVPIDKRTREICNIAIQQNICALQYVENQTVEMCHFCICCFPERKTFYP